MPSHLKCEDCGATFIYAAKQTITKPFCIGAPSVGSVQWENASQSIEIYVCPFCEKNRIIEAPEETQTKGKITALISVPNSEVNTRLAEGYEVMEDKIYAKETIMIKRDGISKEASVEIASAQEAYGKLDLADKMAKAAKTAEDSFKKVQP
jgi:hypothetical protein